MITECVGHAVEEGMQEMKQGYTGKILYKLMCRFFLSQLYEMLVLERTVCLHSFYCVRKLMETRGHLQSHPVGSGLARARGKAPVSQFTSLCSVLPAISRD